MLTPEEEFKAKMIAKCVTNMNAEWQKDVLEASINGNALPEYPKEMQLKALMQAELVKVSQHGFFAGKSQQKQEAVLRNDDKTSPPTPAKPKSRSS